MSKQSLLLAIGSGLALAGLWDRLELGYQPPAYRYLLDPAELARQTKTIDDRIRARKLMLELRDGILERLAQGKVSLPQACDQVYQNAREVYPSFLHKFAVGEKTTPKEKMARYLVACFRLEGEYTPSCLETALRLEQDLACKPFRDWCRRPWADERR